MNTQCAQSRYANTPFVRRIARTWSAKSNRSALPADNAYCWLTDGGSAGRRLKADSAKTTFFCRVLYDHITPVRYVLHWLPIEYRIKYKIICLTFKVLKKDTPCYLRDLLFVRDVGRPLRNENCFNLYQPIPKTKYYGERAFSICSPKLWNGLPTDLRSLDSFDRFKSQLKTYLFKIAYSIS